MRSEIIEMLRFFCFDRNSMNQLFKNSTQFKASYFSEFQLHQLLSSSVVATKDWLKEI